MIKGLGMVASGKRNIRSGSEFEKYFDRNEFTGKEVQLKASGDTFDTIVLMKSMVQKNRHQTAKIARLLKGKTRLESCENIWKWVYNHFQYRQDSAAAEQLRTPLRSWVDRKEGIDCDCMSILISSILTNLSIPHALRKTKYSGKDYFQHIYVVVPSQGSTVGSNYITLDAVVDRFNYEVPFSEKHDLMMPINQLSGLGGIQIPSRQRQRIAGFTATGLSGLAGIIAQANPHKRCFCHEFNGLGAIPGVQYTPQVVEAEFLIRMKEHLQNTLTELNRNPDSVRAIGKNPATFRKQLELLINNWDVPELRDKLLDQLEAQENAEAQMNGFSSLNGLFSSVKNAVKKVSTAVANTAKTVATTVASGVSTGAKAVASTATTAAKAVATTTKKVATTVATGVSTGAKAVANTAVKVATTTANAAKTAVKAVADTAVTAAKAVVKYNPLSVLIRNGLLLALKLNLFRMSERLGYGLWTEAEAQLKGLNITEFRKLKATYDKTLKVHLKLQGDKDSFDKNLKEGWDLGTKKYGLLRGVPGLGPLGEVATATAGTAAASGVIASILAWLSKINWTALFQKLTKKPDYSQEDQNGMNMKGDGTQLPKEVLDEMNSGGFSVILPGTSGQGASVATPYTKGPAPLPMDVQAPTKTAGMSPMALLIGASVLGGAIFLMNKK
jgi:hypothetical protein